MSLSDISIKNPVFAWMLMLSLLLFGGICFQRMGVSQLPDVDFPVVSVNVNLEGAAPEAIEVDVVDPIEDALLTIPGIFSITSSSKFGSGSITVEFALEKDIDLAVQEVQNALGAAMRRLPKEVDPPVVRKTNPESNPIMWIAVTADKLSTQELMTFVRDRLKDQFSTLPGVAEVFLGGYLEPNLRVWLDGRALKQNFLTATDIVATIQQEHAELPAGRIETSTKEYNLRTMGEAPTAEAFSRLPIIRRGGAPNFRPIPLSQVARVENGVEDVRRISRSNGKTAVGLGIRKQPGSNAVDIAHAVKARMSEVAPTLPEGVQIEIRSDSTKFIEEAIGELNFTLLLSAVLTGLVCWLFLGSWSATFNVLMAIPTSIVGTFIVLYALGFTLNTFTLLALSLAIGIVVDDAIMVLENIFRHRQMKKSRRDAAADGAREIAFAALVATAAIIAIFLPVAFMKGLVGRYFFQFGVTLSVAVAISLLEALTLTPMRCAAFLEISPRTTRIGRAVEHVLEALEAFYRRAIPAVLTHRWKVVLLAIAFFGASLLVIPSMRKEFVPAEDQSSLIARMTLPMGSSLEATDEKFKQLEKLILDRTEVHGYFGVIGGFGGDQVNTGMMFLTLKPRHERPKEARSGKSLSQQELAAVLRDQMKESIPGARIVIQDPSLSGFSARRGFPVEIAVQGPDWEMLADSTQKLMEAMEKSGQVVDVDSDHRAGMPEYRLIPNRDKARLRGVSIYDIGETVRIAFGGVIGGKYSQGGHRYDVRVQLEPEQRRDIGDLSQLLVRNNRGEFIPLTELVEVKQQESLQSISRQDRTRAITVYANLAQGKSQAQALEVVQKIAKQVLPTGYFAQVAGSAKTFGESFQSLIFALILGLVVSYMILGSQFNSFIHPVTVLVALPFSVSGALITLVLAGQSINIYSMIGLVLLMGIVKKNSILLVDFTNQSRANGLSVSEALREACPLRLRPILMTSVATVAGAIPPALAIGPGAESRIPLALTVIGGVTVSTALTLFVVPAVYSLLSRFERAEA
jgi:hydrophobe/amphiphile efflux-1 (HAE1) family protein